MGADGGVDAAADAAVDAVDGDAGADAAADTAADVVPDIDPTLDRDDDGLTDLDEITIWGTSPTVADTDGDGFSDKQEVIDLAFDPEVDNFQFNPLVADRPELEIELALAPIIYATYTTTAGTSESIGEERSAETRSANSRSWGGANSYAVEQSHTVGVSVGFEGWKMTGSVSYEYSYSTTSESSSEWSREQSTENAQTLAAMETFEETNEVSSSGGFVAITVTLKNPGNIAYFVENLTLSAYELDPLDPEIANPVGTLVYLDGADVFPRSRLEPGEESAPLSFAVELDVPTIQALLADSRNLMIAPGTSLIEGDGTVNFELASTAINARTAEIIIDYGFDRATETYRVSTVANEDRNYITVDEALTEILRIPYTEGTLPFRRTGDATPTDTFPMLTGVRDFGSSDEDTTLWTVIHHYPINNGADFMTDQYHPFADALDLGALQLQKGHTLQLVRIVDADRDGLGQRAEYAYGTDPNNADTDADGCDDGFEVAGWTLDTEQFFRSDPTLPNSDFDVFNDCEEFAMGTDPMTPNNTAPTVEIAVIGDGVEAAFVVTFDDAESNVLEIRYTVDGGTERTRDVSGETSPVTFVEEFRTPGEHTFSAIAFDGQLVSDAANATHVVEPSTSGLTHFWPIDGTTDSEFSGSLPASIGGFALSASGVRFVTDRFGRGRGGAFINPGGNHGIMQTDGRPILGPSYTMAAWVQFGGVNSRSTVFGQYGSLSVGVGSDGIRLYDTRTNGFPDDTYELVEYALSGSDLDSDEYYLIVVTLHSEGIAQTASLYVNGGFVGSGSLGSTPVTSECTFVLGQPADGELECNGVDRAEAHENGLNAAYDDIRIYNRALSANEVLALHLEVHE